MDPSQTPRPIGRISTGSHHSWCLVPILESNIFSEEPFTCLSKNLGVIQKQCSEVALCVHPLVIIDPGAEIVEDYLKLGIKAEISPIKFQQV